MQTFLPYADFIKSADILDKKRCWKQVVEAKQIISILSHLEECPKDKVPWMNHPAVKMWVGYEAALKSYFDEFLWECTNIHGIHTKYKPYIFYGRYQSPWWLGNEEFHRAMRARLIEKDRDFYLPLFPEDEGYNDGKYWWPVMETKTFRII
jgi:hypothetical protein